ncbi:hypothetical protein MMC25_002955 [Agyrium rufum]|nr:hypothetical protein [Agyrium rufum]
MSTQPSMPITIEKPVGQAETRRHDIRENEMNSHDQIEHFASFIQNSQASSLNDSAASQPDSQVEQLSGNGSQSSVDDSAVVTAINSLTSAVKKSVRSDHPSRPGAHSHLEPSAISRETSTSRPSSSNTSLSNSALYVDAVPQGQKRFSNGHLKQPSITSPISPVSTEFRGHSRRPSNVSTGSQVGDLAAQLRTRLSYAMLKVQHGWQEQSIDEIECIVSRQSPPYLGTASPRRKSNTYSAPRTLPISQMLSTEAPKENGTIANRTVHGDLTGASHPSDKQATDYPLFQVSGQKDMTLAEGATGLPSLAPPFDLGNQYRRSTVPQPPPIRTTNLLTGQPNTSAPRYSTLSNPPATPPPKKPSALKSPATTTTPREQDAIETLLTMASPSSSQQYGGASAYHPGSPLRHQFQPPVRRVMFAADEIVPVLAKPRAFLEGKRLTNDIDIERVLDAMSQDESSDDE